MSAFRVREIPYGFEDGKDDDETYGAVRSASFLLRIGSDMMLVLVGSVHYESGKAFFTSK